jgi:hypothetical protein
MTRNNSTRELARPTRRSFLRKAAIGAASGVLIVVGGSLLTEKAARAVSSQLGWRWCSRCKGLFFGDNGTRGACPAGFGGHNGSASFNYDILYRTNPSEIFNPGDFQELWRWCSKCQGMAYSGNGSGRCPAGGGHSLASSFPYVLDKNPLPEPFQADWRWCGKCQGLFYGPQQTSSWCPGQGQHVVGVSLNYSLFHL